jgi:hypothetical protein
MLRLQTDETTGALVMLKQAQRGRAATKPAVGNEE